MGNKEDILHSWTADLFVRADAVVNELITATNPVLVVLLLVTIFIVVLQMIFRTQQTHEGTRKTSAHEPESPAGTLERFDAGGVPLAKKNIFEYEPEWEFSEDGESALNACCKEDGDEEELLIAPNEFAIFRINTPDEDFDWEREWLVVIVGRSGEVIFKETIRNDDDERLDPYDNYIVGWDREDRPISIYCGNALAITALTVTEEKSAQAHG